MVQLGGEDGLGLGRADPKPHMLRYSEHDAGLTARSSMTWHVYANYWYDADDAKIPIALYFVLYKGKPKAAPRSLAMAIGRAPNTAAVCTARKGTWLLAPRFQSHRNWHGVWSNSTAHAVNAVCERSLVQCGTNGLRIGKGPAVMNERLVEKFVTKDQHH